MSIKKKLAMSIATGALAVSMIGGGTYAYFSDEVISDNNKFAAGTLDINVKGNDKHNAIINVDNLKPGDTMQRTFVLSNTGSLDVSQVLLTSKYTPTDAKGDNNGADIGEHIKVKIFRNVDKNNTILVKEAFLNELNEIDVVKRGITTSTGGEVSGLPAKTTDTLTVEFEFVDNGDDQNIFQGDSLSLEWTFDAKQTAGAER